MKKILFAVLMLSCWFGVSCPVWAGPFVLTPKMTLQEKYNDNIFFSEQGELDDWVTRLGLGLQGRYHDGRQKLVLDGKVEVYEYSEYDQFEDTDRFCRGRWDFRITERWDAHVLASYRRDSQPDRDLDETGQVLSTDTRKRQTYGLGTGWVVTEKQSLNLDYTYRREDWDDPTAFDFYVNSLDMVWGCNLGGWWPNTTGRVTLGYDRHDYRRNYWTRRSLPGITSDTNTRESIKVKNSVVMLGFSHDMTELFYYSIDAGARHTRTEDSILRVRYVTTPLGSYSQVLSDGDYKYEDWNFNGRAELGYKGLVSRAALSVSHELKPSSRGRGAVQRVTLRLSGSRRLTEGFSVGLTLAWHRNEEERSELDSTPEDSEVFIVNPRLTYRFNRFVSLEAGYEYATKQDRTTDHEWDRHLATLTCRMSYPFFE